jgi:hypothetical protein
MVNFIDKIFKSKPAVLNSEQKDLVQEYTRAFFSAFVEPGNSESEKLKYIVVAEEARQRALDNGIHPNVLSQARFDASNLGAWGDNPGTRGGSKGKY